MNAATHITATQAAVLARGLLGDEAGLRGIGPMLPEPKSREEWLRDAAPLLTTRAPAAAPAAAGAAEPRAVGGDVLRAKAVLELKLAAEADRIRTLEASVKKAETEQREALQSLTLQQRKLKEMQDERSKLLAVVAELESKLRLQINETEQTELKLEKQKASQRTVGDQATQLIERISALERENQELRADSERARRERKSGLDQAELVARAAHAQTAEAAFLEIWRQFGRASGDVLASTHVATRETFERLAESFIELLRAMQVVEMETLERCRELRQVSVASDAMSTLYRDMMEQPKIAERLRTYLATGEAGAAASGRLWDCVSLCRAALSGLNASVVRSREMLADELNWRRWPVEGGFAMGEDAAVGRHFRRVAQGEIPDRVGTALRGVARDQTIESFEQLRHAPRRALGERGSA